MSENVKMTIYGPATVEKPEPPREIFVALDPACGSPGVTLVRLVDKTGNALGGGVLFALSPKGYYVMKGVGPDRGVQLCPPNSTMKQVSDLDDLG